MIHSYKGDAQLSGVIYLHRISDNRMGGNAMDSYRLFRKLCGNTYMSNVVTTTMWASVTEPLGSSREREIENKYFAGAFQQGARLHRHTDTAESARDIIRDILHHEPQTLLVQQEMVDQHKPVPDTQAGNELISRLERNSAQIQKRLDDLRRHMDRRRQSDEESHVVDAEELRNSLDEAEAKLARNEHERTELRIGIAPDRLLKLTDMWMPWVLCRT